MARYSAVVGLVLAVAVMVGALIMLVSDSALMGPRTDLLRLYLWSIVFIVGVFVVAWGYARVVLS